MARKYLNAIYLDPTGRNFEAVAFQQGKPLSAAELDLAQDIIGSGQAAAISKEFQTSGWLSGNFWGDPNQGDFSGGAGADEFILRNRPVVHVNGWVFPVEYTGTSTPGENIISLAPAPSNAREWGMDFVYLEVWRATLSHNNPAGKPAQDKVWPGGNILAGDPSTWLDDDFTRTPLAMETTGRVQIQYALRHHRLTDTDLRVGYLDAALFAQGLAINPVPGMGFVPGVDPGLWVAGDGDPDNGLGSADGYVYSIPLCFVYRRNTADFNFQNNGNGGSLTKPMPDGLRGDQIVVKDIMDARTWAGHPRDWGTALERNTSLLLDNQLGTWLQNGMDAHWAVGSSNNENSHGGTHLMQANDILPQAGVTPVGGNVVGNFDGLRRLFSDKASKQAYTVVYAHAAWSTGLLGFDLAPFNPIAGASITNILGIRLNDKAPGLAMPVYPANLIEFSNDNRAVDIHIDALNPPVPGSTAEILVTYEIEYPAGGGLNALILQPCSYMDHIIHKPSVFNTPIGDTFTDNEAGRGALAPYISVEYPQGGYHNREVKATYHCKDPKSFSTYVYDTNKVMLPETPLDNGTLVVTDPNNPGTPYPVDAVGVGPGGNVLELASPYPPIGQAVTVGYTPERAFPSSAGATFYYETPALQAIPERLLVSPLEVEILSVPPYLYTVTASSASPLEPYPYTAPSNQIPMGVAAGEDLLCAPGTTMVGGFDADAGFLQLSTYIPMVTGITVTLADKQSSAGNGHGHPVDYYATVASDYQPSAFAKSLSHALNHKTFIPVLGCLRQDTPFARKGSVVLIVFSQAHEGSAENKVVMGQSQPPGAVASLYIPRGRPVVME